MFSHLLVPVDGTPEALEAVDAAIAVARTCKARIHLLHVVPSFPAVAYLAERISATRQLYEQEAAAKALAWLGEASGHAFDAGVACEGAYTFAARAYEAIVDAARDCGCDLIVMAAPLRRGPLSGFFTREAQAVIQSCAIPVLAWR